MKNETQYYLAVAGVIIIFDVAAAFASRTLKFDYTSLVWVSWGLYLVSGYFGCKFYGLWVGALAGTVAGLADSTGGWMLSSVIGPYAPIKQPNLNIVIVALVIIIVSLTATFFGLVGALLCRIISKLYNQTET
jgi:hypothetical protein